MNNLLDKIENLCQTPYYLFYRDRFIYNITSFRKAITKKNFSQYCWFHMYGSRCNIPKCGFRTLYSYGDNMVFRGVGAYRNNMTPFFINSRPPIVEVIDNDNFRILRDRQTVDEMIDLLNY